MLVRVIDSKYHPPVTPLIGLVLEVIGKFDEGAVEVKISEEQHYQMHQRTIPYRGKETLCSGEFELYLDQKKIEVED